MFIPWIESRKDKLDWEYLSSYMPHVNIPDKVHFHRLSINKNIYTYDYEYYRKCMNLHREELMKKVFHPTRLIRYLELGYDFAEM